MAISLIRTLILFFIITLGLRVMGKRQVGDLEPSELVVTMMISELATIPIQDTEAAMFSGIGPIIGLIFLEVIISYISLKSKRIRRIIPGKPTIIIHNGHIDKDALEYLRLTRSDVLEQLRLKGFFNILEVEFAIMEKDGQISVKPIDGEKPLTKKDFQEGKQ